MLFYQLTQTKQFHAQLNALPADSQKLVLEKITALSFDPRPMGRAKKSGRHRRACIGCEQGDIGSITR